MISCGDAEEFVPFGREHMVHHPGEVLMTHSHPPPPDLDHLEVLKELNTVSLNSSKVSKLLAIVFMMKNAHTYTITHTKYTF